MNTRQLLREALVLIAAITAVAAAAQYVFPQDGAQSVLEQQHAAGTLEPIPLTTAWQESIQAELDAAGAIAKAGWGRTVVVAIPGGAYEFVSLTIPPNVILVGGHGLGVEADLVYVGGGDSTAITLRGGYSTGLAGIRLRCRDTNVPRVVGVKVDDVLNGIVENVRVDLRGLDTVPYVVAARESLVTRRVEFRGSQPIRIEKGDNLVFRDCDLGASGNVRDLPNCVLHLVGLPHQITFDGAFTAQGGDHLIYSVTDAKQTGQGLAIYNLRYEQSTSTRDATKYAIDIRCNGRTFENLVMVNCRWTDRLAGISIVRNPAYPLATKITLLGCFLPGSR